MPNRQWFCWNLCLKYSCGCSRTSSQHVCDENRGVKCHSWMATRVTNRTCDKHRDLDGPAPADEEEGEEEWRVEGEEEVVRVVDVPEGEGAVTERGRRVVVEGGEGWGEGRPGRRVRGE